MMKVIDANPRIRQQTTQSYRCYESLLNPAMNTDVLKVEVPNIKYAEGSLKVKYYTRITLPLRYDEATNSYDHLSAGITTSKIPCICRIRCKL